MELLQSNLKTLPRDIIDKIISYTYSHQCPIHLENIKHYVKTKRLIIQLYHTKYTKRRIPYCLCIFRTELFRYLRFNILSDKLNKMCYRHILFTNKQNIEKFMKNFNIMNTDHYVVNSHIKIFWSMLYPNEREEFITNHFTINEIFQTSFQFVK